MNRLPLVSNVSCPFAPVLSCKSFGIVSNGLNCRPVTTDLLQSLTASASGMHHASKCDDYGTLLTTIDLF